MKKIVPYFSLLPVLFLSLWIVSPFFRPGFFETHDGEWAIVRLAEMVREIKDWQIPPRWSDYLNHGYGYPLFSFTYPLPYYLGSLLRLFGLEYVSIIKLLFASSVFLSGITMFFLADQIAGRSGAILAWGFYLLSPYRMTDLYIRGSIGESLSFVFFPLIFYLSVLYAGNFHKLRLLVWLSLTLALLFLTHNVMGLLFFPFWLSYLTLLIRRKKLPFRQSILLILKPAVLAFSLAAFFIMPALLEKKFLVMSQVPLADKSANFLSWQDVFPLPSLNKGRPDFGLGPELAIALSAAFLIFLRKKFRMPASFFLSAFLLTLFLVTPGSLLVWQLPLLSSVDFPWGISGLIVFFAALSISFLKFNKTAYFLGIILLLSAVFRQITSVEKLNKIVKKDDYYLTNDATTTSADELMPVWVKTKPTERYNEKAEIIKGEGDLSDIKYNSKEASFFVRTKTEVKFRLNTIYYPGWFMTDNGKPLGFEYDNELGVMEANVARGDHFIKASFRETPARLAADILSMGAFAYCIILFIRRKNA